MTEYKAHDYPEIYKSLGIDLRDLGCVMLETEEPDTSFIKDEDLYVSPDPKKFWIKGRVEGDSHVTLRYGLLPYVRQKYVFRVLADVNIPSQLFVNNLERFDSPYPDEEYECIVARVGDTKGLLQEINSALGLLPNINTFSEYKPHVTLAYVRAGWWDDNLHAVENAQYDILPMRTLGFDLGGMSV